MGLWDTETALIYLGWYVFCVVAWAVFPSDWVEGVTLRNGKKKKIRSTVCSTSFSYKCGLRCVPPLNIACHVAFSTFLLALGLTTGYIM
ncbi:hypothetical protein PAXINDRAFT_86335 [Paxillus involutus ATCC 200175]|uniref:Uncharacterized protein n=1 Tax=Paxillus involutus ATCC 200175 TaxID=664439 RepID=A0A0C9TST7_PAXIN|nr:hypothetical protein PAXINDRAFT_86335 [Paxillus involutus ATCC 200175]